MKHHELHCETKPDKFDKILLPICMTLPLLIVAVVFLVEVIDYLNPAIFGWIVVAGLLVSMYFGIKRTWRKFILKK